MPKKGQVIQKYELIKCACGCGKEFNKYDFQNRIRKYLRGHNPSKTVFQKGNVPWIKGIGHTAETRLKMSKSKKGSKSPTWKGGICSLNQIIRGSLEYRLWREAVFKRDNWTCVWCGDNKSGKLNADHIKPFAHYPELRFAIDNGRTLCVPCHKTTDTYAGKSKKKYA